MRALVSTLPKSGTHFINLTLAGMGMERVFLPQAPIEEIAEAAVRLEDNQFLLHHYPFTPEAADRLEAAGVRTVVVVRDPRDFVVSFAHHARRYPSAVTQRLIDASSDMYELQDRIASIELTPKGKYVPGILDRYLKLIDGWVKDGRALVVRFEEMIGPQGGGRMSDQLNVGLRLHDHLRPPCGLDEMVKAMVRSFNPTIDLFRKGQTEAWREEMRPELAARILGERREVFQRWGYREEGGVTDAARAPHPGLDDISERAFRVLVMEIAGLKAAAQAEP